MKTKVSKVLIAMDYNPTAQKVAETGYSLAKSMNAEITLLHVISDPVYYYSVEYSPIMGFNGFIDPGLVRRKDVHNLKEAALDYLDKQEDTLAMRLSLPWLLKAISPRLFSKLQNQSMQI